MQGNKINHTIMLCICPYLCRDVHSWQYYTIGWINRSVGSSAREFYRL